MTTYADGDHHPTYTVAPGSQAGTFTAEVVCGCGAFRQTSLSSTSAMQARTNAQRHYRRHYQAATEPPTAAASPVAADPPTAASGRWKVVRGAAAAAAAIGGLYFAYDSNVVGRVANEIARDTTADEKAQRSSAVAEKIFLVGGFSGQPGKNTAIEVTPGASPGSWRFNEYQQWDLVVQNRSPAPVTDVFLQFGWQRGSGEAHDGSWSLGRLEPCSELPVQQYIDAITEGADVEFTEDGPETETSVTGPIIYFTDPAGGLWRVGEGGGSPSEVAKDGLDTNWQTAWQKVQDSAGQATNGTRFKPLRPRPLKGC